MIFASAMPARRFKKSLAQTGPSPDSLWHDEATQEHVIRAVWVEPIGDSTRQAATAKHKVRR
jgi:hypothetical protein